MGIEVGINYYHYKEGPTKGHLAVIIPVEEYRTIISENAWMYDPPVDIKTYNPTAANVTSAVREVKETE